MHRTCKNQLIASLMKLKGNTLTYLATRQIFQDQQITSLSGLWEIIWNGEISS